MKRFAMALLMIVPAATASADEGMWLFDHVPVAAFRQRHGVELTDAWLENLRLSTVRLGTGCTGSFVSPDGLILTNHHCAQDALVEHSTPQRDLLAAGFLARSPAGELRCSAYEVSVLVGIEDVTRQVEAATAGLDDQRANEARKRVLTQLEMACEDASRKDPASGPLVCQAVTLYEGGQYDLYKYKRYDDVRLVFAPEYAIAGFGGDPDNFQFPRWCFDLALLRVYENGRPARTPHFLRIDFEGPREGEPVFVAGHPGATDRLLTVEQLRTLRAVALPRWLLINSELRGRFLQFAKIGAEENRIVQDQLLGVENSIKARRRELDALLDDVFTSAKRRDEDTLRARVAADPQLRAAVGDAWGEIARAEEKDRARDMRYDMVERGSGFRSELYRHARVLVRAASERAKPNDRRLREYTDGALPYLRQQLLAPSPIEPRVEDLTLSFSLERMREWLGPDDAFVKQVLGADSPDALAARLVEGTALADTAVRRRLWDGGIAAIQSSTDPMIVFARSVDPEARGIRTRWEDDIEAPVTRASERIARARFRLHGTREYPDATFTLRLNDGSVRGWIEDGRPVPPFTTLGRAFERATGQDPFLMPAAWLAEKSRLDPRTPFNLCSTNDIVGGNSGSPMVNARGELVGLIFDGNIHSISGSYWFDAEKNRAVAVHPAIIREALTRVYRADALMRELSGPR